MRYSQPVSDPRARPVRAVFATWQERWRAMEALATRRGWGVTPLAIAPPATPTEMHALEALATERGFALPEQLRAVLAELSARVAFGWQIPVPQVPHGSLSGLTAGGLRNHVWSLEHIAQYALPNFANWRAQLETRAGGERPNRRKQWQNQFAIAELVNGDMLTIDCSHALGTAQPVRYFSHELEGLHGAALAPDLLTFIDRYTDLGCAGGEHSDWFRFCTKAGELRADTEGALEWKAWCESEKAPADEPPAPLLPRGPIDHELHAAAKRGDLRGVIDALDRGAQPDCIEDPRSRDCVTPLIHAVRNHDLAMIETLLARGASANTKRLALSEAIEKGCDVTTVRALLARRARANGWKGDRYFPVHRLLAAAHGSKRYDDATRLVLLEALLAHDADPDARWDGQRTMLMECTLEEAKLLFARGANPLLVSEHGDNALHSATTSERVRFFVTQAGVAVDTRTTPRSDFLRGCTALHLRLGDYYATTDAVATLLELGADPHLVDARGASAAFHCHRADDMELLLSKAPSLDLRARMSDGGTLLHYCAAWREGRIGDKRSFMEYVIERGCELDAQDARGRTVLHMVAAKGELEDVQTILDLGADRALLDRDGRTAGALVPKKKRELRKLITGG